MRLVDDQFARAGHSPRTAEVRLLGKPRYGADDALDDEARSGHVVGCDVRGLFIKIPQGLVRNHLTRIHFPFPGE